MTTTEKILAAFSQVSEFVGPKEYIQKCLYKFAEVAGAITDEREASWKEELADLLDRLGTTEGRMSNNKLTFNNLEELVFQLRKKR